MEIMDKKFYCNQNDDSVIVFDTISFNPLENGFDIRVQYVKLVHFSRRQHSQFTTRNRNGVITIKSSQINSLKGLNIEEAEQYITRYWVDFFNYSADSRYKDVISIQYDERFFEGKWGFWNSEDELKEALGLKSCPINAVSAYS